MTNPATALLLAVAAIALAAALFWPGRGLLVRWAAMSRLNGFTGDVAGAQVELVEVGLLLVLASRGMA